MPLVLDSASVVVKGNFNPYIFSPEWLANQDVWAQQEVHLALGMLSDGIRFRNALGDTTWEVDSKTLVVQSISNAGFHQSVDTAEAAALAAESFSSCKQRACDMIKSILGEEVTE